MSGLISLKEATSMGAYLYPNKTAVKDLNRSMTYKEYDERCSRLGNALLSLGLKKGDRFAALAYNCVEWMEIYGAAAKTGLVLVPIMFRLVPNEYNYILENCEAGAFIIAKEFVEGANSIRDKLNKRLASNYIFLGNEKSPPNYYHYDDLINSSAAEEPSVIVNAEDPWSILYTSGTTGKPKGAIRTHASFALFSMTHSLEMGFNRDTIGLMVMPMCHANSFLYSNIFVNLYGTVCVYNRKSFDPEDLLRTFEKEKITWTSLVPTQYIMILSLPDEIKNRYNVSTVRSLLCSSAPVRKATKLQIMDFFKNAKLFEGYGSTEAGIPILLRPEDQIRKLGSVGREMIGVDRTKIFDEKGKEVPIGQVGEIYTKQPFTFKEYWNAPDKTASSFRGEYFSAGDMGYKDEEGFLYLVDRKQNMIITGGENVYPSEVENVVLTHKAVKEAIVIGVQDEKWGESVKAIVVLKDGYVETEDLKQDIIEYCKDKIAGYKRPRSVDFIKFEDVPRNATGKVLYTALRDRYGRWSDNP